MVSIQSSDNNARCEEFSLKMAIDLSLEEIEKDCVDFEGNLESFAHGDSYPFPFPFLVGFDWDFDLDSLSGFYEKGCDSDWSLGNCLRLLLLLPLFFSDNRGSGVQIHGSYSILLCSASRQDIRELGDQSRYN